jgi:hypothetical protein
MAYDSSNTEADEAPALIEYGTIEEWTQGARAQIIDLSIGILDG